MKTVFHLIIEAPSGGRFEHRLAPGTYMLGREEGNCDLVIPSPEVSREHVRLPLKDCLCTVEDLGSHAGYEKHQTDQLRESVNPMVELLT